MIRYALACEHEHPFEAWFGSSDDYDDQAARGLVECPFCASRRVRKQIMAPAVRASRDTPEPAQLQSMMMQAASKVREHIASNFDYVGDAFASEARAIHEGRTEDRDIYGQATGKEVMELVRDGVPVSPMPPKPPSKGEVN